MRILFRIFLWQLSGFCLRLYLRPVEVAELLIRPGLVLKSSQFRRLTGTSPVDQKSLCSNGSISMVMDIPDLRFRRDQVWTTRGVGLFVGKLMDNSNLNGQSSNPGREEAYVGQEPVSVDTIRALVQEELNRRQGNQAHTPDEVLETLLRESWSARTVEIQKTLDEVLWNKSHSLIERLKEINSQIQAVMNDSALPVTEKVRTIAAWQAEEKVLSQDLYRVGMEITENAQKRVETFNGLDAHPALVELRQEVEKQKQQIAALPAYTTRTVVMPIFLVLGVMILMAVSGLVYFNPFKARNEENARLLIESASLYQATGQIDDALRVLDDTMAAGVTDPTLLGRVGEMYRLLKNYDKAIGTLTTAVNLAPKDEAILLSLARSYSAVEQNQEAANYYEQLVQIVPDKGFYYLELGNRYRALKQYDQAIARYQIAIDLKNNSWPAYLGQGDVYREQGKPDDAIASYTKALEFNPENYTITVALGMALAQKEEYGRAIETFQTAITYAPERADAYFQIGEAYRSQGLLDEAVEPYQEAIDRNEAFTSAYLGMAKVYVAKGDCASAEPFYQKAQILSPNNPDVLEGLAVCHISP